jgi:hypothetical protein
MTYDFIRRLHWPHSILATHHEELLKALIRNDLDKSEATTKIPQGEHEVVAVKRSYTENRTRPVTHDVEQSNTR